jgi:hypothetical protein
LPETQWETSLKSANRQLRSQLYLTRLIPSARLQRDYLLRLVEGHMLFFGHSAVHPGRNFASVRSNSGETCRLKIMFQVYYFWKRQMKKLIPPTFDDHVQRAAMREIVKADEIVRSYQKQSGGN